jgi:hypothetical protein
MTSADNVSHDGTRKFKQFRYDQTGLRGQLLRLLTDDPTDDAGVPQDLPPRITDVVSTNDEVGPNLSVRVHPPDDPGCIAYVALDQLALYEE